MFDKEIIDLLLRLVNNGYPTYLVGGVVRDHLLGVSSNDYDVTTLATPDIIKETYKDKIVFSYGEKFGTIGIKIGSKIVEITTFRTDCEYLDNRHPKDVKFGKSLEEDVKRRDLTINGLVYDFVNDKIIDYVGGYDDLTNHVIRVIGNPTQRFKEDALRILRAIRFYNRYHYKMDDKTKEDIFLNANLLANISKERITEEVFKMFQDNFYLAYDNFYEVFKFLMPELNKENVELFKIKLNDNQILLNLVFLAQNSTDPEKTIRFFKCEKKMTEAALHLFNNKDIEISNDISYLRKLIYKIGLIQTKELAIYKTATGKESIDLELIDKAYTEGTQNSFLNIKGNEIQKELGCESKDINKYLFLSFNAVVDGIIINRKEDILEYLRKVNL